MKNKVWARRTLRKQEEEETEGYADGKEDEQDGEKEEEEERVMEDQEEQHTPCNNPRLIQTRMNLIVDMNLAI